MGQTGKKMSLRFLANQIQRDSKFKFKHILFERRSNCTIYYQRHLFRKESGRSANDATPRKKSMHKGRSLFVIASLSLSVLASYMYNNWFWTVVEPDPNKRENVVILGTGWGAISFFEGLDLSKYNVTIVSPRNYSLFTPMLASVTTGHVDNRSIVNSIHDHIERHANKFKRANPRVEFFEAKCFDVDWENQLIHCEETNTQKFYLGHLSGTHRTFSLPYDKLVVAVGCRTNTFNTPGVVENCYFLKEIDDAHKVRMQIWTNLEMANCPGITEQQRENMLNFCVVGGGPTGVEFAGELNEVLKREVKHFFPNLAKYMKITLIQSADHILNTFDARMTKYAEEKFLREGIKVIPNTRVIRVTETDVTVHDKVTNKDYQIPYGMCLWATGIMQHPLISTLSSKIGTQEHTKALEVDACLRVVGIPKKNVFALGDCCKVNYPHLIPKMTELFEEADVNKDGYIQLEELKRLGRIKAQEYPHLSVFVEKSIQEFPKFDLDGNGKLDPKEFENLLIYVDNRLQPLPATAQVANQQGKYLAKQLNQKEFTSPFNYKHLGSFAYLGRGDATADIGGHIGSGYEAWLAYKAVYFSKQVSLRNKLAILSDWLRVSIFGRDMSKV